MKQEFKIIISSAYKRYQSCQSCQELRDAHNVYTNTRSCSLAISKLTCALKSRDQELSNGIWHPYIYNQVYGWYCRNMMGADLCVTPPLNLTTKIWQIRVPLILSNGRHCHELLHAKVSDPYLCNKICNSDILVTERTRIWDLTKRKKTLSDGPNLRNHLIHNSISSPQKGLRMSPCLLQQPSDVEVSINRTEFWL